MAAGVVCASGARAQDAPADTGRGVRDVPVALLAPASTRPGRAVTLRLRARNAGRAPLAVLLGGLEPPACSFWVYDALGRVVWPGAEQSYATLGTPVRLALGDSLTCAVRWPGADSAGRPVRPGRYTLRGTMHGSVARGSVARVSLPDAEARVTVRRARARGK